MLFAAAIFFALDGAVFGSWAARVPDVARELHLTPTTLGAALFCISLGALTSMQVTGYLCDRFGSGRIGLLAVAALSITISLPALARNLPELFTALFIFGIAGGAANVAANSLGVDVQEQLGRPVMSTLHATFSLGGLVGSLIGGVVAPILSVPVHLLLVSGAGITICACLRPRIEDASAVAGVPARGNVATDGTITVTETAGVPIISVPVELSGAAAESPSRSGAGTNVIITLGAIAGCTAFAEGALSDWGALHLRENLHADPTLAASGYALFSLAMAAGRLAGHRLVARFGDTRLLVTGTVVAAVGAVGAAFGAGLPVALAGFLLVGLGLANVFPLAIGRAGLINGPRGVGLASTVGYTGLLAGPPVIGFLAAGAGLPTALSSITVLALLAAVLSASVAGRAPARISVATIWRHRQRRARARLADAVRTAGLIPRQRTTALAALVQRTRQDSGV